MPEIQVKKERLEWNSLSGKKYEVLGRTGSSFDWEAENGTVVFGQGSKQVEIDWIPAQTPYKLKVKEKTRIGCEAETDFVSLAYDSALFVPNLITPNGDGKNDHFEIVNLGFSPESELTIFDRWGKEVYASKDYKNYWPDGKVAFGTYFFMLKSSGKMERGWILVGE
jgi:gliding motility-associated-like protein